MNDYSDPKIRTRLEETYDELSDAISGSLDCDLAHAPDMTPIEKMAYVQLAALVLMERVCRNIGMCVEPQKQIGKYRVDFLLSFMGEQFIIECDGHDFHERTKEQAAQDKQRDRDLQRLGFKVFRFTGSEIWRDIDWLQDVVEEIDAIRDRAYQKTFLRG